MKKVGLSIIILCVTVVFAQSVSADMKLGVNTARGALFAMKTWGELGNYLSNELGQPVEIVPIVVGNFFEEVQTTQFDLILSTPGQAVFVQEKLAATPLATLNDTESGTRYGGVIIAKKGSGITKSADLKGKKVISLGTASAAAYFFQMYHLYLQNIDPYKDFAVFKQGKKLEDLVLAVKAGLFDAAFIRTNTLESMAQDGTITLDEFEIVDQRTDPDFPYLHTTSLYPNWVLSVLPTADSAVATQVKDSILKLTPDSKAAQTAHIKGFVDALSLDDLRDAMKAIKLPPYDK